MDKKGRNSSNCTGHNIVFEMESENKEIETKYTQEDNNKLLASKT